MREPVAAAAPPPAGAAGQQLAALLVQRDPGPEPADRLDKDKGEEDAVLERVAAPARGRVGRVVRRAGGRGVGEEFPGQERGR